MKTKIMHRLATLTLLAMLSSPAIAGERGGNGGDGISIDGNLYVLDLVEAGAESGTITPFTENAQTVDAISARLRAKLPAPVSNLLAHKMAEISKQSPVFGEVLLQGIELYQWRLVNSGLINIQDENSLLDYQNLIQLAIRRNGNIMINRVHWEKLDTYNQAALVLHEIIYALVKPVDGEQDSVAAREIVGQLFINVGTQAEISELANDRLNFGFPDMNHWDIRVRERGVIDFNPKVIVQTSRGQHSVQPGFTNTEAWGLNVAEIYVREACAPPRISLWQDADIVMINRHDEARIRLTKVGNDMMLLVSQTEINVTRYQMPRRNGAACTQEVMKQVQDDYNHWITTFANY